MNIRIRRGDLRETTAEALVREAVSDGSSRTNVDRRTEAALGMQVLDRITTMGEMPVGTALLTPAGSLRVSFVVHLFLSSREEPLSVRSVDRGLRNGIRRAADFGIRSLALPPIGMGVGNADPEGAALRLIAILEEQLALGTPPNDFEIVVESEFEEEIFLRAIAARGTPPDTAD